MPTHPEKRPGQPGGKRAKNRLERISSLKRSGLALFLARGIESVTIDEITRGAGVAKGTFYRYFDDKADVVASLMEPIVNACDASLERFRAALEDTVDTQALFNAYATLGSELGAVAVSNPELVRLYLQERRSAEAPARVAIHRLAATLDESVETFSAVAVDRGLLRDLPPAVTSQVVIGAVEQLLFSILAGRDLGEPRQVVQQLISLVLEGLIER